MIVTVTETVIVTVTDSKTEIVTMNDESEHAELWPVTDVIMTAVKETVNVIMSSDLRT